LVNGKPDASTPSGLSNPFDANAPESLLDLPTQILLGQLPLLLAPARDDVLVIGLGSGLTLGSVLTHPVKDVECIELEDAVVQGSRFFEEFNGRPLADPRTKLVVNDARNHLVVTERTYNVIISEPSNPWIPGAANLFTREFFEISRSKLQSGGVFCQWIQLYELQSDHFDAILRTFLSVFPEVHLFRVNHDAILVGSEERQPIHESELLARLTPSVRQDLERIFVDGVEGVLARYWVGGEDLIRQVTAGPVNTDDNMLIEFAAPLQILANSGGDKTSQSQESIAGRFAGKTRGAIPHVILADPEQASEFWAKVSEETLLLRMPETTLYSAASLEAKFNARAAAVRGMTLAMQGFREDAHSVLEKANSQFPDSPEVHRALARIFSQEQNWASVRNHAEVWVKGHPDDPPALFSLGRALYYLKESEASLAVLKRIPETASKLDELKGLPFYLGALQADRGDYGEAARSFHAFLRREPAHFEARVQLANSLYRAGRPAEAAVQWQGIARMNANKAAVLQGEAEQDWVEGKPDVTARKLEQANRLDPSNADIVLLLARVQALAGNSERAIHTLREHLAAYPDQPAALGYLSQILIAQDEEEAGRLMAARYRALTGEPWRNLEE
jgi:spermidine synthase/tetratricopeptide (TPR) repeat protein